MVDSRRLPASTVQPLASKEYSSRDPILLVSEEGEQLEGRDVQDKANCTVKPCNAILRSLQLHTMTAESVTWNVNIVDTAVLQGLLYGSFGSVVLEIFILKARAITCFTPKN
jgi:hypothetical protein